MLKNPFYVLGIETSCDETSVGLVCSDRTIVAHEVFTQFADHQPHGGVVPELGARAHLLRLPDLIRSTVAEGGMTLRDVDVIAAATGPGLLGGVIVGTMMAKAMATSLEKLFVSVNHIEAHALTVRLLEEVAFPYLLLLVSGGHTQLLWTKGVGDYTLLATTLDDAVGEAFDKTARLLGLGYPGGPLLEQLAKTGDPHRFKLPRPLLIARPKEDHRQEIAFSFSGLKTAVRQLVASLPQPLTPQDQQDMAASFQQAIADILVDRCQRVFDIIGAPAPFPFVVAGGVAANKFLKMHLKSWADKNGLILKAPPIPLCTDNGAMIAWTGVEYARLGRFSPLDVTPRPRWPLSEMNMG